MTFWMPPMGCSPRPSPLRQDPGRATTAPEFRNRCASSFWVQGECSVVKVDQSLDALGNAAFVDAGEAIGQAGEVVLLAV